MDWTTQSASQSEQGSIPPEQLHQTVTLRDLELPCWRSAENYETSASNGMARDDTLATPLDTSGMADATDISDDCNSDSMSSVEGDDSGPDSDTTLEYARFHGLCRDYEMDDPLASDLIPLPEEDFCCDDRELGDALDHREIIKKVHDSLSERLEVDRDAATFLMSTLRACKQYEGEEIPVELKCSDPRGLKLELPVLSGDHEVEMISLRRRNEVRLDCQGIEPFQLDNEKGESIEFSSADIDDKRRLDDELRNEKLDVGKETVELLRQLRELASGRDDDYASEAYQSYKKGKAIRISPPLLPVTPPYSPPAPAPEAMQVDLTSTPEDLIAKDAAAVEEELLALDQASVTTPAERPPFDAQEIAAAIESYTAAPSSSSPLARKRIRNLRLETPLTPQYYDESSSTEGPTAKKAKKVQFDLRLASLLPEPHTESSDLVPEFAQQQMDDLQRKMTDEAESVKEQLRNEQLIEFDTTMRVKVPCLEAVQIHPPWNADVDTSNGIKPELLKDVRKWSGVAKIERSLQWAPFASYMAKIDLAEQFDDGSLGRYLNEMDLNDDADEVDAFALIARDGNSGSLPGHDSDEEDMEPVITEEDDVVDDTLQQLQQEVVRPAQEPLTNTAMDDKPDFRGMLRKRQRDLNKPASFKGPEIGVPVAPEQRQSTDTNVMQTSSLAQFMQLQGKITSGEHAALNAGKNASVGATKPAAQNHAPAAVMVPRAEKNAIKTPSSEAVPIPNVLAGKQDDAIPVVVSSAVMARRSLIRQIQTILPNVDFCERDATIAAESQHNKSIPKEADFTISPSTGVVITTLQKLKQKPLPGQTSTSGLHDVIATTSVRYERLLVLVSEGNNVPMEEGAVLRMLDQLDCEALNDLIGWANALNSDVQISYVPGGENEIAGWLAATLSHRGVSDGSMRLLQDETMWERWLRVAGMNAYAAQAVLVQLKLPDADMLELGTAQKRFGLAAFLSMTAEERVDRFASTLGGERVLRRVSEIIDGKWTVNSGKLQNS